jgi:hypothetical protein
MSAGTDFTAESDTAPRWVVVANMTRELRGGLELGRNYNGTRKFSPGTKLYLGMIYAGMAQRIHAIGLARDTRKFVNCVIAIDLLLDIRSRLIYSPATLIHLARLNCTFYESKEAADARQLWLQATTDWERSRRSGRFGHWE